MPPRLIRQASVLVGRCGIAGALCPFAGTGGSGRRKRPRLIFLFVPTENGFSIDALSLVEVTRVEWHERAQFFAMAAQMMRRILVDAARARGPHKRGGMAVKVNIETSDRLRLRRERPPAPICLDRA
jgi:hypothetical protein